MNRFSLQRSLRLHWGLYWLGLVAFVSYILLHFRPMGLHYLAFTGAAQAFWAAEPMYATRFASGAEGWLYSPACAAFFYSFFAFFPPALGRSLYMLSSLLFLAYAICKLRAAFHDCFRVALDGSLCGQLFWILISSELTGAILAEKLEISILAVFFLCIERVWRCKFVLPAVLLAVVGAFKFQSLPMLALLFIVYAREGQIFKPLVAAVGTFIGLFFAPFLFQNSTYLWNQMYVWRETLTSFMRQVWMAPIFHHVYGFAAKNFGISIPYDFAQHLSEFAGLLFAGLVAWQAFAKRERLELCAATAVGLGATYAVLFSPLSQGTGYILYIPLPLLLLVQNQVRGRNDRCLLWVLGIGYFFASLCVSDLTPQPFRAWFYTHSFKALGPMVLFAYFLKREFSSSKPAAPLAGGKGR